MQLPRLALILGSVSMAMTHATVHAEAFPSGPVTIVVPFPPGGGTDTP